MIQIIDERPGDATAIEKLLNNAFGPKRKRKISYRFRQRLRPMPGLSLVAESQGVLAGTIRHWPIVIADAEGSAAPALLLGPLAVAISHRGQGIGAMLISEGLTRARIAGYDTVILVGDLAYYRRFGFQPASRFGITMPNERPERVLAVTLSPDVPAPRGTVRHAASAGATPVSLSAA